VQRKASPARGSDGETGLWISTIHPSPEGWFRLLTNGETPNVLKLIYIKEVAFDFDFEILDYL
jgi:hypothetical protein